MDLFSRAAAKDRRGQPLAERMRPQTLGELVGQQHILGPGKLLRRVLEARELPSLILWGPPGTGKTTLGRLLAAEARARFVPVSAGVGGGQGDPGGDARGGRGPGPQGGGTRPVVGGDPPLHKGAAGAAL